MPSTEYGIKGLTSQQVLESRMLHGRNEIHKEEKRLLMILKDLAQDPMLILLLTAACLYFIMNELANGIFMTLAIFAVTGISLYQQSRSHNAIAALKKLTQPKSRVIRDGKITEINSDEIVMGDYLVVEEGMAVSADGIIVHSNDFSVNESVLTGESLPVSKDKDSTDNKVFHGTTVTGGLAICRVDAIGVHTALGKIGKSIESIREEDSPLQKQIRNFVKKMVVMGAVVFFIVWTLNFLEFQNMLDSLLRSLTLAMSILPEEIPVAFATFMALGARRLMQLGVIVKQTKTVETLGSATVICVDKTGTITENHMTLAKVYVHASEKIYDANETTAIGDVVTQAMWASEPIPFDPMEQAIHAAYGALASEDQRPHYKLVHEYPLSGKPPLMTHIFQNAAGNRIIAAKGAPESLLQRSDLSQEEKKRINDSFESLAKEGYRVLGVAEARMTDDGYPESQEEFKFTFKGLVAFYDPPKENMKSVLRAFYNAGIDVKILTGDTPETARTIASQIDFRGTDRIITGDQLLKLSEKELNTTVMKTSIFARIYPEIKLKIINLLKQQQQIVAMTGDGVNDGPALKAADIGIAMGKKGSEIAKEASALVLVDDDLSRMVEAVATGRRIYNNLKKAIQYIISIHIPIILIVFIPLVMGWAYPAVFTPVHVIFFELIMGPTCSIIYENEPIEKNLMDQKPRQFTTTFFTIRELLLSIIQGIIITGGLTGVYWYAITTGKNLPMTTAMIFITLITANISLTMVNRSFYYSVLTTSKYKNGLVPFIITTTILLVMIIFLVPPVRTFFSLESIGRTDLSICVIAGILSVIWFEVYKWMRRRKQSISNNN